MKVKKHLFKALVRPRLEYSCVINRNIRPTDKTKMQVVQNKDLRFIKNLKKNYRVRMKDLHQELQIDPINVRIDMMSNKTINRMKELYLVSKHQDNTALYKYSDYTIQDTPSRTRRKSSCQN